MEMLLKVDKPLKGRVYTSEIDGKIYTFKLLGVQDSKASTKGVMEKEKRSSFGFASKKIDITEEDLKEAEKSFFKEVKL